VFELSARPPTSEEAKVAPAESAEYPFNGEFTSRRPDEVASFYEHFAALDELIAWMRDRPASTPVVHEVPGETEVAVVIPTARFEGELARRCRETTFRGLQLVFLESPRFPDPYFNLPAYVNLGIRCAMAHRPAWIILSGDDVLRVDEPRALVDGLAQIDPHSVDTVFTTPSGRYHSLRSNLAPGNAWRRLAFGLSRAKRAVLRAERKFGATLHAARAEGWEARFFGSGYPHLSYASFGILSAGYVEARHGRVLDETFGNSGSEDVELSLRLSRDPRRVAFVKYRIDELRGATLGVDDARRLREVAGLAYLNQLVRARPSDYFAVGFDSRRLLAP